MQKKKLNRIMKTNQIIKQETDFKQFLKKHNKTKNNLQLLLYYPHNFCFTIRPLVNKQ